MSQQIEIDRREDQLFLVTVLVIVGLGVIATLIALTALNLSFPAISLGQKQHRLSPPTPATSSSGTSQLPQTSRSPSVTPTATGGDATSSPTLSGVPTSPGSSQTHGITTPLPTSSLPGRPTLPSPLPLPSFSISIGLPSPLPSLSLGLHP